MSFTARVNGTVTPNFLESAVGLVLKTVEVAQSQATEENGKKIVKSGTVLDGNVGILFEDVDVTTGNMPGAAIVAGRVVEQRLNVEEAAKTALKALGIVFVQIPETER